MLSATSVRVEAQQVHKNKVTPLQYYCTHLVTNFFSPVAMFPSFFGAIGAGAIATEAKDPLIKLIAGCLATASFASAGFVFYKLPQWTDTYLLELPTKRRTVQNIISLLMRLSIPFPFGSLLSEIIIKEE